MAVFDFVQSTTARATSAPAPTFGSSVTAGSIIIVDVLMETDSATVSTVTDNKSNTYVWVARVVKSLSYALEVWYALNVAGGASFTVTATGSAGTLVASIHEYLGNNSVVFDAHNEANAVTTVDVTTTGSADLMHGFGASGISQPGAGSGYARREAFVFNQFQSTEDKRAKGVDSVAVDFASNNAQSVIGVAFKSGRGPSFRVNKLRPAIFTPGLAR